MSGFAVLHRSLLGHPAFRNDAEAMAFAWMILRASWRPVRVRYKGKAISLNRGQLAVSVRDMAEAMDRDKAWIERLFKRLRDETMIETRVETGVSVITICNYTQYQDFSETRETATETPDDTDARQTQDTEQQDKPDNQITSSEAKASSPRARVQSDFPKPDWADEGVWADFLKNRKRKRLPNTTSAYKGFLEDIDRIANDEWPPGRLLGHAAKKGWGGIYEPDEMKHGNNRNNGGASAGKTDAWQSVLHDVANGPPNPRPTANHGGMQGAGGMGRDAIGYRA